jgi:hypothetical protein
MEEVSHKQIYDRLVAVEKKVDHIDQNTAGMVVAFQAAAGAFTVLNWLAQIAKPILWIVGVSAVIWGTVEHFFKK